VFKGAEVATDDKEVAFRMTNTIIHDWTSNAGVTVCNNNGRGHRSTSVGDVFELENGELWRVATMGFTQIPIVAEGGS
jgi:hypothetical protein